MLTNLLSNVICETFLKEYGRNNLGQAMMVTFSVSIDYDKEHGYRYLDLLIYAPSNYVQVWARDRSDVIPLDDMDYDDSEDESYPREGKDYVKTTGEWRLMSDHSSCWTEDGVSRIINQYSDRLQTFASLRSWHEKFLMEDDFIKHLHGLKQKRLEARRA